MFREPRKRKPATQQRYNFARAVARHKGPPISPADMWIRDVHEEGIEPHPGPRFITKNLDGVNDKKHFERIIIKIKHEHTRDPITAIFLQEHKLKAMNAGYHKALATQYGFILFLACARDSTGGTAILMPKDQIEKKTGENLDTAISRVKKTMRQLPHGRGVAIDTLINGLSLRLASVYAPAQKTERPVFFRKIGNFISPRTVLGIDANCVPNPRLDVKSNAASPYENDGADDLQSIILNNSLADVAREWLGDSPFFTSQHNTNGGVTYTRIDRIYAPTIDAISWEHVPLTHDLFDRPPDALILDHEPAQIRIKIAEGKRGNEISRINESVYDDLNFNQEIVNMIDTALLAKTSWADIWNDIKKQAFKMSKAESMKKKFHTSTKEKQLQIQRDELKGQIDAGRATQHDIQAYLRLSSEASDARKETLCDLFDAEDIAFKKGGHHDTGSASFYRPFTPRGAAQWINSIFNASWTDPSNTARNGSVTSQASKIAAAITPYYKALFARKQNDPQAEEECLKTLRSGNRVLPPTAEACGKKITTDELEDHMNTLPDGKSPGPDGLPYKFYKTFSAVLAPILEQVFNESHSSGLLPPGCSDGYISLLYKKKDRQDPRNYRPLTLLNADYKLLMRILAKRMAPATTQFVSPTQTGFVPDAFIGENVMLLKLIQAYIENEDQDAYFIFLDMEKAFDRCSWEFLIKALKELGFDDAFIRYIQLAYSHDNAPKRKLYVNGYLGPEFSLGSGVSQGCPISPLLFLVIAEPLARLILANKNIKGVEINGHRHKISQYADDSTLIGTPGDEPHFQKELNTWQAATCMKENSDKREGQLLGKLNKEKQRAPKGVIANDAWLKDGNTIRALGVPMGNDFSIEEWYSSRYSVVKERVSLWPSIRRLSITGRNMLLQSIFYGSFRYWLYFLIMPQSIMDALEQDSKQILWATDPLLLANEKGTARASRRYIHHKASYLPQDKGGGGIMHWPSHCEAYYAEWIVRYLHPRIAPWKTVAAIWINDPYIGHKVLLSRGAPSRSSKVPESAPYLRRCLDAFHNIKIRQDTDVLDHTIQAEPFWKNNRFSPQIPKERITVWKSKMKVATIKDMYDTYDNEHFSPEEWDVFFRRMAPNENISIMRGDLRHVIEMLPREVYNARHPPPQYTLKDMVVCFINCINHKERYAYATGSPVQYQELWLDTSRRPHKTGNLITITQQEEIWPVEIWDDTPSTPHEGHGSVQVAEIWDRLNKKAPAIMGPFTTAFPRNIGWFMKRQQRRPPSNKPRKLSDLTVSEITAHLTSKITRNATPNCVSAWKQRLGPNIPFSKIFASFGTPLSDPSEERQWRKLVHRAIFVRGRNPNAPDQNCRLCRTHKESQLHLFQCMHTLPLWRQCLKFTQQILGAPQPFKLEHAVILGMRTPTVLLPEVARAFLRHAFQHFYHDFANVDVKEGTFTWQYVYRNALLSFRDALLRYGRKVRVLHSHRTFTSLTDGAPQEAKDRFSMCMDCDEVHGAVIKKELSDEIEKADAAAKATTN